ncbi:hypothetical protein ABKV19_020911 [Rosa sericea]
MTCARNKGKIHMIAAKKSSPKGGDYEKNEIQRRKFSQNRRRCPSCMFYVEKSIPGLVNVDFADIRAIMANAVSSLMGIGSATGKTRARDAALNAIQSPLLNIGIERATGIVWNITGGTDLRLYEVNAAADVIYDLVDPTENLIFGAVTDPSLRGQVSITLIATGFKRQEESDGRPLQAQGDITLGINQRPSSFSEGSSVEIPDFLKKKGRSCYPRV